MTISAALAGSASAWKTGKRRHRFDLQQQVAAPGHVRRQRRADVDDAGDQRRRRREAGEAVAAAHVAKRCDARVQKRAPGGRVAARGEEVVPVLDDEPARDEREQRQARVLDDSGQPKRTGEGHDCDAQLPLVDTPSEHAHAWAKLMAFESDHLVSGLWAARSAPTVASIGGRQAVH